MKIKKIAKPITILVAITFVMTTIVLGQDKTTKSPKEKDSSKWESSAIQKEREKYTEDKRPEENYLAKFISQERVEKLIKKNLEQIYMLKVVVSNFPQDDWGKRYKDIYEGYKKGMGLYYKRDVIYSRAELEKNKKNIDDLFKKMSDKYNADTEKMLDVCAESILIVSLNARTKADPNKAKQYYTNLMRIRIAYGQMDDAMSAYRDNIFQTSIFHFRIAKSYAIKILEELLRKEEIERNKGMYNKEEYDGFMKLINQKEGFNLPVHKADILNRIMEKGTKTSK